MTPTIEISKLNLEDWFAIAAASGMPKTWGLNRWEEHGDLSGLTLDEWGDIAVRLGFSRSWGYYKFVECRKDAA